MPQWILNAAYIENNPSCNFIPIDWTTTIYNAEKDREMRSPLEVFEFMIHLREPHQDEFYTVNVDGRLRLPQAPENIELLKFFIKDNKSDEDYKYSMKLEPDRHCWKVLLGICARNHMYKEFFTNTYKRIQLPNEHNNLVGGEGTLAMRVMLDEDEDIQLELLIGTGKDQILGPHDVVIGHILNYRDVQELFQMVDTREKVDRYDARVIPTVEFV